MAGGTNQTKPRGTGMPQGFAQKPGAAQAALQDFYNPTTGQTYTHSNMGATPGQGWMAGKPPPGEEYAQWKDPNAPPKYGGFNPGLKGGGGFGGWNPGGGGGDYWGDLRGRPPGGQPGQFGGWSPGGLIGAPATPQIGQPQQYGSNMPPGFPGYDNLPKNWQDEGYSWQDPNNPNAKYNIIA